MVRAIILIFRIIKRNAPTFKYFGIPTLITLIITSLAVIGIVFGHSVTAVLVVCVPLVTFFGVLFICSFVNFVKLFYYGHKVEQHDAEIIEHGRVITLEGAPGSGKSLTIHYDAVILAEYAEFEKTFEYLLQKGKEKTSLPPFSNDDARKCFESTAAAVEYYREHSELIPFLLSTVAIKKGEQYSAKLNKDHFLQDERLPEGAVLAADETADILSNKLSKAKKDTPEWFENLAIDDLTSKCRHYADVRIVAAEQDASENYIGFRRVVSMNRYLDRFEKVATPGFLIWLMEYIKRRVVRKDDCTARRALLYLKLEKLVSRIGFFKIHYQDRGNTQKSGKVIDEGCYCLPINLGFKYATRAFRLQYKALDKPLALKKHKGMYLPKKKNP